MPVSGVKLILPTMSPTKVASVVTIGGAGLGLGLGLLLFGRYKARLHSPPFPTPAMPSLYDVGVPMRRLEPYRMTFSPVLFLLREQRSAWAVTVAAALTETVCDRFLASSLAITISRGRAAAKCRWRQWVIRVATEGPGPFAYTDADLSRTTLRLRSPGDNAAMSPTMRMPYVSIKS